MIIGAVLILGAFVVFASGESEKKDNNGNATSNATTSTQKPAQEEVTYEDVNATDLMDDLESNAAVANKKYLGRNLRITNGIVRYIDSNGNSFSMTPATSTSHNFLASIKVSVEDKKAQEELTHITKGGTVVVYGQVTRVGDTLGYSVTAKKIEVPSK